MSDEKLDEGGGLGEGPQLPPWSQFRFHGYDLERWFDGRKRTLRPDVDFPTDAPFKEVKRRLEQAAHRRRGRARVWRQEDGTIGVLLVPPWTPTLDSVTGEG